MHQHLVIIAQCRALMLAGTALAKA